MKIKIRDVIQCANYEGCLKGKIDGKIVHIPAAQKPYFFSAGCVNVIMLSHHGWDEEPFAPKMIEVEPGVSMEFGHLARSQKLVDLCRQVTEAIAADYAGFEEGKLLAEEIEIEE